MIPTIYLHRFEFHKRFAQGLVLDVGCSNGPGWTFATPMDSLTNPFNISDIIFVDCDSWEIPWYPNARFIRAFAEDIPLPDKYVDTIVLGDILEHVENPDKVLSEAKRLTRDRIVITVPNEWKWEKDNPNILSFETREKHLSRGRDLRELGIQSTLGHPSGNCKDALDDTKFEHIHHKHFWNEETFTELIKKNAGDEFEYFICNIKYNINNFVNLACIMWRK